MKKSSPGNVCNPLCTCQYTCYWVEQKMFYADRFYLPHIVSVKQDVVFKGKPYILNHFTFFLLVIVPLFSLSYFHFLHLLLTLNNYVLSFNYILQISLWKKKKDIILINSLLCDQNLIMVYSLNKMMPGHHTSKKVQKL